MSSKKENDKTLRFKTDAVNKKSKKKSKRSAETQVLRTNVTNRNPKYKKNGKKKFKYRHPRVVTCIKIFLVILMLVLIIGGGIVAGTFFGVFGDELKINESELVIKFENSTMYDKDGNQIATLSSGQKRKCVSLSEMAEYLPKAYVAIEDERFYEHSGVDILRTGYATVNFILHAGKSSFGGSTITQQLIKNITQEKENTSIEGITRKVKEMAKAVQVEHLLSKSQILELYLNTIYIGGNDINGVALGAQYYFNKDVKDLSLAECAFMAGINNSPGSYKPFYNYEHEENKEKMDNLIKKRTKTVLGKMKEVGYITDEEEYKNAVAEVDAGLKFEQGEGAFTTVDVSYHTEAAITQIINQVMEEKGMSKDMAEVYIYSGGLKIYTTLDPSIQDTLEEELLKDKYCVHAGDQQSMLTMTIVDHTTGQVVACGAGTSDDIQKTKIGYFNWPTMLKKQTGSSMKPLAVIAPGLEKGVITASTTFYDGPTDFNGYTPKEWYGGYKGLMNMRKAIEISANIPHVKALSLIGLNDAMDFCDKIGIKGLKNEGLSLALGGLEDGVSSLQMAMGYAMIANDGVYIEPTFYTKIEDSDGNVILEPHQQQERMMSVQNAYIEKDILTEPVVGGAGTARYCAIPGMDVAAKTGTTNSSVDRWLCGFTPYYTAATWFGFEKNAKKDISGNLAGQAWDAVMTAIHSDLEGKRFERPDGVVEARVCRKTGKVATGNCNDTYTELFATGTVPSACEGHTSLTICKETGLIANDACPDVETAYYSEMSPEEASGKWSTNYGNAFKKPTSVCKVHSKAKKPTTTPTPTPAPTKDQANKPDNHTHKWAEDKSQSKAATCTEDGYKYLKCSECTETKKETIKATGHKYGEWQTVKEATITAEGERQRKCSVCGNVEKQAIPKKEESKPKAQETSNQ